MSNAQKNKGVPKLTSYVLIDFENVRPKNLEILANYPFKVIVFVGANQTKVPLVIARALQSLGSNAEYVEISGSGKNALDFHIAYYIGKLAAEDPKARFHVISRDKGFDPLIRHLNGNKVRIQRESDLAEIPELRIPATTGSEEQIDLVVKNLAARGHSRPRKVKTLQNTINNLFTEKLDAAQLSSLVEELRKRKLIVVSQGNVSYKLPR